MATDASFSAIEKTAIAKSGERMTEEYIKGNSVLARDGGAGFIFLHEGHRYDVSTTNRGICTIQFFNKIDPKNIFTALRSNYYLSNQLSKSAGDGLSIAWKTINPSRYQGGIIILRVAKEGTEDDGMISIAFFPAKLGLKFP